MVIVAGDSTMLPDRVQRRTFDFRFWLQGDQMKGRLSRPLSRDERAVLA